MATFFNDIQAAFDNRLNTLSGGYDIAWPNIPFEPQAADRGFPSRQQDHRR